MIQELRTFLIYISVDLIFVLMYALFISSTLSMRFGKVKYIIIHACCFVLGDFIYAFLHTPQYVMNLAGICTLLLSSFTFSNDKPIKILSYTMIPYALHSLTLIIYIYIKTLLFKDPTVSFGASAYADGFLSALFLPLPLFLISRLLRRKKTEISDLTVTYLLSGLTLQTMFVFFCIHMYFGNISFPFFMSGLLIFMVLTMLMSLYIIRRTIKINRENSRREIIEDRYKQLSLQYENLRNSYLSYKKLRHDLNDHIRIINGLAQRGENTELSEYTKKLTEDWDSLTAATFCDLPAADIILSEKYSIAVGHGIDTDFLLSGIKQLETDSVYLCSILSNLLNNAIEAAAQSTGERFIRLRSDIQMNNLVITCRNSVPKQPVPKPDSENHGFGLEIIKELAELLGGNFIYSQDDSSFSAAVTIPAGDCEMQSQ